MKRKPSAPLHQAWSVLRKAFSKWKSEGKIKDPGNLSFLEYKQARGHFQRRYRQEDDFKFIRDNNTIMQAEFNNKNGFFNLIKT